MTRLFQCCLIWLSGTFSAVLKALLAALAEPLLYLRVCDAEWYGPLLLLHHDLGGENYHIVPAGTSDGRTIFCWRTICQARSNT